MNTLSLIVSFGIAVPLVLILRFMAPRIGLVDLPTARKRHQGAVPLVGGLAIVGATASTMLAIGMIDTVSHGFAVGLAMVLVVGLLDDRFSAGFMLRLVVQGVAIIVAIAMSGNVLPHIGRIVGTHVIELGAWAIPFTVFGWLGVVNAMNLSDGVDGLAGGIALTALIAFIGVFQLIAMGNVWPLGPIDPRTFAVAIAGAIAGFLVFNLRHPWRARASVFLGDAGSLALGFTLGWFAIFTCSQLGDRSLYPVSALWILLVPIFDTTGCIVRRKLERRSPMSADRRHLHHLLQRLGCKPGMAVAILITANAVGGMIGVFGWYLGLPESLLFGLYVMLLVAYLVTTLALWREVDIAASNTVQVSPVHAYVSGAASIGVAALFDDGAGVQRSLVQAPAALEPVAMVGERVDRTIETEPANDSQHAIDDIVGLEQGGGDAPIERPRIAHRFALDFDNARPAVAGE